MTIAIRVQNLSKEFKINGPVKRVLIDRFANILSGVGKAKRIQPLKDVSFELKAGECLGVIGRNGAGKTTLLKTIVGIYHKDAGNIEIDGKILFLAGMANGMSAKLSVRDNIFLMGAVLGLTTKQIKSIYDDVIEFSGLEDFIYCKVYQLSSGMKQRLAFSSVIHSVGLLDPDILLLDEVLSGSGGDEEFKDKANEKVQEFLSAGKTMIMVSHSLNNIKKHCERVIWMEKGQIKMQGHPDEVTEEYMAYVKALRIAKK